MISAESFEAGFASSLTPDIEITSIPAASWLPQVIGDWLPAAVDRQSADRPVAGRLAEALTDYELLCPSFELLPMLPVLLRLRELASASWRLLLIAHSPALYGLEWLAISPLLRAGDVVVAPTASAADIIELLCPAISRYVHVIPHPVPRLAMADRSQRAPTRLVSLTRIHPAKLLHRQLDALQVLHRAGHRELQLTIAGPLQDPAGRLLPYARTLMARAYRYRLDEHVYFPGAIVGSAAKAELLAGSDLLLNLSLTVEESFGKSIVEGQWTGLAAVVSDWNGLPETMGGAGAAIPLTDRGSQLDLSPEAAADAIQRLLDPPPDLAMIQDRATRSAPERVRARYLQALRAGPRDAGPSSARPGLLARTAPLTALSPAGLDRIINDDWPRRLAELTGTAPVGNSERELLAGIVFHGIRRPLELFMSGLQREPVEVGQVTAAPPVDNLRAALALGAAGRATASSLTACLGQLADANRRPEFTAAAGILPTLVEAVPAAIIIDLEATRLASSAGAALDRSLELGGLDTPYSAHRLLQLVMLARLAGRPAEALPLVQSWLADYPDEPSSPAVAAEGARLAITAGLVTAGSVTAGSVTAGSVTAGSVTAGSVTAGLVAAGSVAAGSVTAGSVASGGSASAVVVAPAVRQLITERAGQLLRIEPLGPRGRSVLVEAEQARLVVQPIDAQHDEQCYQDFFGQLAEHDSALSPALLAAVRDGDDLFAIFHYLPATAEPPVADDVLALLGRLRSGPLPPGERLERRWLDRLDTQLGAAAAGSAAQRYGERVAGLAGQLLVRLADSPPPGDPVLTHGDLSRPNLIGSGAHATLIDWEEFGPAAPGFDAGWLLALVRIGADGLDRQPAQWRTAFAKLDIPDQNVSWFERLGLLRLLVRSGELGLAEDSRRQVVDRIGQAIETAIGD
ncbi:MAG: glycosyltransferase [Actinomycetota bacterium]|nr:glycosyltransferase [Actinomycetota bacterium]